MNSPLAQIVKILVASPSDVPEERKIAQEVISEWNNSNAEERKVTLQALLWELDAAPETGERTQEIINKQIVDLCHFAIGIFCTRIGTDTGVAPGGAVEEVERVMRMGKRVMLYFSNVPQHPKKIDPQQKAKLDQYRASIEPQALLEEYEDYHEFRRKLTRQLDKQVRRWFCQDENICDGSVELSGKSDANLFLYQSTLKEQLGNINLSGSPAIESFSVRLKDTFVSLSLSGTSRCETRLHGGDGWCEAQPEEPVSTPEGVMSFVFKQHSLLLVIGDPGSGKTTLLKYYALSCLDNKRYQEFGFREPVNVFYLPLRDLNKSVAGYPSLQATLSVWAQKYFLEIEETLFSGWLDKPSTLVLLDGLDEISNVHDRIAVCDWIDRTVSRFTMARFVVTSRSTGYRKGDGIELDASHLRADIMDFSKTQQAEFLHLWFKAAFFREIPPGAGYEPELRVRQEQQAIQQAEKKAEAIIAFLAQDKNRSLRSLAGIPLLLQIMAMLWKEREFLPGGRSELYDAALNYMLDYRDRRRGIYPLLAAKDARRVLSPVSLWMQEELKKDEVNRADMQLKMQELLDILYNSLPADEFCRNLVERSGVLVEYGDREYVFRHKSFREYLAGVQLVNNMHRPGYLADLVIRFGDDWWQEVFRFFIGHVEDPELFDSFMQKLFDSPVTENLTQKQQDLLVTLIEEAPQRKIEALQKKLLDPATTPNRQRYILECLKTIGKPEAFKAVQKFIDAYCTKDADILRLAHEISGEHFPCNMHISVSAKVISVRCNPYELDAQYILIDGGTFTFSITEKQETMPDLYVAKYTVTNKLYRQFISYLDAKEVASAKGIPVELYAKALQAEAARIEGFNDYLQTEQSLAKLFASKYGDDKRFTKDDQPVVGVTWYAAKAYCLWLSLLESEGGQVNIYRLPEEVEWEYAAAGKEGRQYPWGNAEPTAKLANYDSNEGATTPVGRYPDGATPEGLYDMAGNVWEWMEDWYDKNASDKYVSSARALRGGSWFNGPDLLRCSARYVNHPAIRYYVIGFRVVRSSPSS
jgi:formylglycine-generating enzyme required for sulfatase activity